MPIEAEAPPLIVQVYATVLFLGGIAGIIHFFFLSKRPKRIEPERSPASWMIPAPDFLFGLGLLFFLLFFLQVFLTRAFGIGSEEDITGAHIVTIGMASHLIALGLLYTFYRLAPQKFPAPMDPRHLGWRHAAAAAAYGFLVIIPIIYPAAFGWQVLLEAIGLPPAPQDTVLLFGEIDELHILVLMVILTVLIAPVSEELIFRGCIYRFLKGRASIAVAMIISGALFALLHHSLSTFLPLFLLGVLLAYSYEKSGTIKVPIILHSIFNLNTVTMILLTQYAA